MDDDKYFTLSSYEIKSSDEVYKDDIENCLNTVKYKRKQKLEDKIFVCPPYKYWFLSWIYEEWNGETYLSKLVNLINTLHPLLKYYKFMAAYGGETWVTSSKILNQFQSTEMEFLTTVKGCTKFDKLQNEDIWQQLRIFNINKKLGAD